MKLSQELKNAPAIPGFHAVEESRKWKQSTARKLQKMTREERIAYLNRHRERFEKTTSSS